MLGKVVKLESTPSMRAFYTRLQSKPRHDSMCEDSPFTPELRNFIDRVAVPILMQDYLSKLQSEKQIAENAAGMALCELMTDSPASETTR